MARNQEISIHDFAGPPLPDDVTAELGAIRQVVAALEPLDDKVRRRVLDYAERRYPKPPATRGSST